MKSMGLGWENLTIQLALKRLKLEVDLKGGVIGSVFAFKPQDLALRIQPQSRSKRRVDWYSLCT